MLCPCQRLLVNCLLCLITKLSFGTYFFTGVVTSSVHIEWYTAISLGTYMSCIHPRTMEFVSIPGQIWPLNSENLPMATVVDKKGSPVLDGLGQKQLALHTSLARLIVKVCPSLIMAVYQYYRERCVEVRANTGQVGGLIEEAGPCHVVQGASAYWAGVHCATIPTIAGLYRAITSSVSQVCSLLLLAAALR